MLLSPHQLFASGLSLLLITTLSLFTSIAFGQNFQCAFCNRNGAEDRQFKTPPPIWDQLPVYAFHCAAAFERNATDESYDILTFGGLELVGAGPNTAPVMHAASAKFIFSPPSGLDSDTLLQNNQINIAFAEKALAGASIAPIPRSAGLIQSIYGPNIQNGAFIYGGIRYDATNQTVIQSIADYFVGLDPSRNTATFLLTNGTGTLPEARAYQTALYSGAFGSPGVIIVFGGIGGAGTTFYNNIYQFNLSSRSWRQVVPNSALLPPGRQKHGAAMIGRTMYVLGGAADESVTIFSDFWAFNFVTGLWTSLTAPSLTYQRLDVVLTTTSRNTILAFGGRSLGVVLHSDLWEYDPIAARWAQICYYGDPQARYGFQIMPLFQDKFVLHGGIADTVQAGTRWRSAPRIFDYRATRFIGDCPHDSSSSCLSRWTCQGLQHNLFSPACGGATPFECHSSGAYFCVQNRSLCPRNTVCDPYQESYLCSNGMCAFSAEDCYPLPRCPSGQTRCRDGRCATLCSLPPHPPCPGGQVMCPDGCALSCDHYSGCPSGRVQCPNGMCDDPSRGAAQCTDASLCPLGGIPCDDGTCAQNILGCSSSTPIHARRFLMSSGRQLNLLSASSFVAQAMPDEANLPIALISSTAAMPTGPQTFEPMQTPGDSLLAQVRPLPRWLKLQRGVPSRSDYYANILSPVFSLRMVGVLNPDAVVLQLAYPPALQAEILARGCLGYVNATGYWACAPGTLTTGLATIASNSVSVIGTSISRSMMTLRNAAFGDYRGTFALIRASWPCPTVAQTIADPTLNEAFWTNLVNETVVPGTLNISQALGQFVFSMLNPPIADYVTRIQSFFVAEYCQTVNTVNVTLGTHFAKKRALYYDVYVTLTTPPTPTFPPTTSATATSAPSPTIGLPSVLPSVVIPVPTNVPVPAPTPNNDALIAGLITGLAIVVIIVIVVTVCCVVRKRKQKKAAGSTAGVSMTSYQTHPDAPPTSRGYQGSVTATGGGRGYTASMISVGSRVQRDDDYRYADDPRTRQLGPAASIYSGRPSSPSSYQTQLPPPPPVAPASTYPAPPPTSGETSPPPATFVLDPAQFGLTDTAPAPRPVSPTQSRLARSPAPSASQPLPPPPTQAPVTAPAPAPPPLPSGGFVLSLDMLPDEDQ